MKQNALLSKKKTLTYQPWLNWRSIPFKKLNRKHRLIEILIFLFCLLVHFAQGQNLEFVNNISNSDGYVDTEDIAVDGNGNIFVTGHFEGDQIIDFDPSSGTGTPPDLSNDSDADSYNDIYLAKYNANGDFQWVIALYTRGATSHGNDPSLKVAGVEIDNSGNIYIAGHIKGSLGAYITFSDNGLTLITGQTTATPATDWPQPFVIAVDTDGEEIWTTNYNSVGTWVEVNDLALSSTDVLITGLYNGNIMSLPTQTGITAGNREAFITALNQNNGSLSSSERLLHSTSGTTNASETNGFQVDGSDNIYVTGMFKHNTDFDPGAGTNYIDGGSGGKTFIAKYTSSYSLSWVTSESGEGQLLELAGDGNVWVSRTDDTWTRVIENWSTAGVKSSTLLNLSFAVDGLDLDSNNDLYLITKNSASLNGEIKKYDMSGSPSLEFSHSIGANAIRIDANDKIHLGDRYSNNTDFDVNSGIYEAGNHTSHNLYLFKYNQDDDLTAPSYTGFTPADGTSDVAVDADFIITFDEPVRPISNSTMILRQLFVRKKEDNSTVDFVNVYSNEISFSGNTITIDLADDLPDDTHMYIWFQDGMFIDYAGNEVTGISSNDTDTWDFSTGDLSDTESPSISTLLPVDEGTEVSVFTDLVMNFDEDVQPGTGNIIVRRYDNNAALKTIDINSGDVTFNGSQVTVDLPGKLLIETHVYVQIINGAIQDLSGNNFPGTSGNEDWDFTTETSSPPQINALSPIDGASDVSVDGQTFTITFNENVVASTSWIQIKLTANNSQHEQFFDGDLTFNNNEVSFTSQSTMSYDTDYYITISAGSFDDEAGSPFGGISGSTTWNFTTEAEPDVTPPSLSALDPADDASGVSVDNWTFTATFDEDMQVGNGTAVLNLKRFSDDATITNTLAGNSNEVSISGNTVSINFNGDGDLDGFSLTDATEYYIEIPSSAFEDPAGNDFSGIAKPDWSFTTESGDVTPPSVSSLEPVDNATGISNTNWVYTVDFDESIQAGSGLIFLRKSSNDGAVGAASVGTIRVTISGSQAVIDFDADGGMGSFEMDYETEYYIEIPSGAFEDGSGNAFAGISKPDWSFTTETEPDVTAPVVVTLNPVDNATDISVTNWIFTIDFDEDVQAGSGLINLKKVSDDGLVAVATVGTPRVAIAGSQITIDFNIDGGLNGFELDHSTEYYLEVAAGAFKDLADNSFAGIAKPDWSYTTEVFVDADPPVVTNLNPANGAVDVSISTDLVLTFNEDVQIAGSGAFSMYDASDDSQIGTTWFFPGGATADGNQVTYNIPIDLPGNTQIYFNITNGIEDLAGNTFAGITNDTDWVITTEDPDLTAPSIISLFPADDATGVSLDTDLVLTADETIVQPSSGDILIKTGTTTVNTIPFDDPSVDFTGAVMTVTGALSGLNYSTGYWVYVPNNAIEDEAGNGMTGTNAVTWNFTTEEEPDITAPSITSLVPIDNATDISVTNWVFTMNFDEDIQAGSGLIHLKRSSDDGLIAVATVGTVRVTVSGSQAEVDFNADGGQNGFELDHSTEYYLEVAAGAFKDLADNSFAGIAKPDWSYTTEVFVDADPPAVTNLNPANGAVEVLITTDLVLTFDEDVQIASSGTFSMFDASDDSQIGTDWFFPAGASVTGNEVTYDIPIDLPVNTQIYFNIDGGIEDLAGNTFAGITNDTDWVITTEDPDLTAPSIVSLSPADDATDVSLDTDLVLTADETIVQPSSGDILIKTGTTTVNTIPFDDPSVDFTGAVMTVTGALSGLDYSTGYWVYVPNNAIKDEAGNGMTGTNAVTWNFTTKEAPDETAPSVTSIDPMDNSIDVLINQDLTITFDEDIMLATGGATKQVVIKRSNNSVFEVVPVTSDDISGNTMTLPHSDFEYGQAYYIYMADGVVADLSNNWFAGFPDNTTWDFVTEEEEDVISPMVTSLSPSHGATDVPLNADLVLTANENIGGFPTTGTILIKQGTSTVETITSSEITFNGNEMTISGALTGLEFNTTYWIEILDGDITDEAGNGMAGTDETSWSFTTEDKTAQTITFNELSDLIYGDAPFGLEATASSGLPVVFTVVSGPATVESSTLSVEGAGEITVQASQDGNGSFHPATPVQRSFTVAKAEQAITFESIDDQSIGNSFELLASATSGLPVSFTLDSGPASVIDDVITLTGTGVVQITATQAGNENYLPAENVTQTFEVLKKGQSMTFEEIDPVSIDIGEFDLTASATSGLQVSFTTSDESIATITNNTLTILKAGSVIITALQPGNEEYSAAEDVSRELMIHKLGQTITFEPFENAKIGDPDIQLGAFSDSGLEITYSSSDASVALIAGSILKIVGPGTVEITTSQPGNDLYEAAADVVQTFIVSKLDQVISFEPFDEAVFGDADFEITVSTSSGLEVSFSSSNEEVATISGNTISIVGTGTALITASQSGNDTYNPAEDVAHELVVSKRNQFITFELPESVQIDQEDFELTGSSDSGLELAYSSSDHSVATISGNVVSIIGSGVTIITASQTGNDNFNPADEVSHEFTVTKLDQAIIFGALEPVEVGDANFELAGTATSGLDIFYTSSDESVAVINGSTVTVVGTGVTVITASQPGNETYNAAAEVSQELIVDGTSEPLGIIDALELNTYPNPATDHIVIDAGEAGYLSISNLKGQLLHRSQMKSKSLKIDVTGWSPGIYVVKWSAVSGKSRVLRKIMISN